jgi:hypothetical protein
MTRTKADIAEIQRNLELVIQPGDVAELRIPNKYLHGYFNSAALMATHAALNNGSCDVYYTVNRVADDLLARAVNRMKRLRRGDGTKDSEILVINYVPIDIDPLRPKGISATTAEHELALETSYRLIEWLCGLGWPEPAVYGDSGNGAHTLHRIGPLDNTPENIVLIQNCLMALKKHFDTDKVEIDRTTYNPARIMKVLGTLACKGDSTPERPHRWSHVISSSPTSQVENELLLDLAERVKRPATVGVPGTNGSAGEGSGKRNRRSEAARDPGCGPALRCGY